MHLIIVFVCCYLYGLGSPSSTLWHRFDTPTGENRLFSIFSSRKSTLDSTCLRKLLQPFRLEKRLQKLKGSSLVHIHQRTFFSKDRRKVDRFPFFSVKSVENKKKWPIHKRLFCLFPEHENKICLLTSFSFGFYFER